jgi:hypothetical protein
LSNALKARFKASETLLGIETPLIRAELETSKDSKPLKPF